MSPNRSLFDYLFTFLIFSLVFFWLSYSAVYAESKNAYDAPPKFKPTSNVILSDDPSLPSTADPPLTVDTDVDADVDSDGLDYYNFISEYVRDDCFEEPPCWFDFNLDQKVNEIDLAFFTNDFGRAGVDAYESDDTSGQARIVVLNNEKSQHHNFHQTGDEDWMIFFALAGETYRIETNLSDTCVNTHKDNCDIVLELYDTDGSTLLVKEDTPWDPNWNESIEWTCELDGVYFVRVYLYNPSIFGAAANYNFRIYQPTAPFPGTIFGTVRNAVTKTPIPYARIRTTAGGSAISFPNGVFINAQHPAGCWQLTATAIGYKTYMAPICVPELRVVRIDIDMAP